MKLLLVLIFLSFPALTIPAKPTTRSYPTKDQLVGRWRHEENGVVSEIILRADGSVTATSFDLAFAGRWRLSGDIITYKYTTTPQRNPPYKTTDRDQFIEVTQDYFIIRAIGTDGKIVKYSRVK